MFYKYRKNDGSIRKKSNIKIRCKLNKELSTDGVNLNVKARPLFCDEKHLVF